MTTHDLVFLDTETLGLDPDAPIWEFAAVRRFATGGEDKTEFQIRHDATAWLDAMPDQFLYDYDERYKPHDAATESDAAVMMHILTKDALVVACNPIFDLPRIEKLIRRHGMEPSWHYHPFDISSVAFGAWMVGRRFASSQIGTAEIPLSGPPWKSDLLAAAVGVRSADFARHTAMGDVLWTIAQWDAVMGGAR